MGPAAVVAVVEEDLNQDLVQVVQVVQPLRLPPPQQLQLPLLPDHPSFIITLIMLPHILITIEVTIITCFRS